jgi:hypothetical protein
MKTNLNQRFYKLRKYIILVVVVVAEVVEED